MRFLLFSFLLLCGLSAGAAEPFIRYVWAPSGLSLRAEGKAGAAKLTVLPHGAQVRLTKKVGEQLTLTTLPEWRVDATHSKAFKLRGRYVEVEHEGTVGYVFSAYLLPYPAPQKLNDTPDGPMMEDFTSWCQRLAGPADTVYYDQSSRYRCLLQYPNGILVRWQEYEGGGGSATVVPDLDLQQGFIFYDTFYGYSRKVTDPKHPYPYPMAVDRVADDRLDMSWEDGAFEAVTFQVVGGLLIFHSQGGC